MQKSKLNCPDHIAIIMDGNGRWATRRGLPRSIGHKEGVVSVERTINACLELGVKICTFFAFSTENWKRSEEEINGIFSLLRDYIANEENIFIKKRIKLDYIGVIDRFPDDLKNALLDTKEKTKDFNGLTIIFALNYGGRDDLVRAINKHIDSGERVDEKSLLQSLDTGIYPEPDIVIRTSGEQRLSNFLLYQMAYSELYFPKVLWPDFNKKHLVKIIKNFNKRERRFGGIK